MKQGRAAKTRLPWWVYLVLAVVATAAFGPLVFLAIEKLAPGLIDSNPIRDESYYPKVIGRITSDANFRRALGAVPVVHEREIQCSSVVRYSDIDRANCWIPVSGPRGKGEVHARIADLPQELQIGLWLHLNGAIIDAER